MADSSHLHAVNCARRAAERAAVILHRKLIRGTTSLQAIARTAPVLGMFGAGAALIEALPGYYAPCYECSGGLSEALVTIPLSLAVAVVARWGFHRCSHQIETLDLEMRKATLELLNELARSRLARV